MSGAAFGSGLNRSSFHSVLVIATLLNAVDYTFNSVGKILKKYASFQVAAYNESYRPTIRRVLSRLYRAGTKPYLN